MIQAGAILTLGAGMAHAASFTTSVFATGGPIGATQPDSVSFGDGSLWVAFQNGADTTGASGSSTVVRYSVSGAVQHEWTIAGNVDGLKVDPTTGLVWALQNNDGNSALTIINPTTNATTAYTYGNSYTNVANRGFDDIVFANGKAYLSETNPASTTDPILLELNNYPTLSSPLQVTGLLDAGPITDPDSLKLTQSGDLAQTGEADQTIIFIHNPGPSQTVTYLPLVGVGTGLPDDTIYPTASQGLIFFADTGGNTVYKVYASGMSPDMTLIDVGNEFGILNTTSGVVTPIATGFSLVSPHGADFVTFQAAGVPEPASASSAAAGLLILAGMMVWRRRRG